MRSLNWVGVSTTSSLTSIKRVTALLLVGVLLCSFYSLSFITILLCISGTKIIYSIIGTDAYVLIILCRGGVITLWDWLFRLKIVWFLLSKVLRVLCLSPCIEELFARENKVVFWLTLSKGWLWTQVCILENGQTALNLVQMGQW